MEKIKTKSLIIGAMIAALYAALTFAGFFLSYGVVQFRFSEALTILPVFTPMAIPGLAIGCLVANINSPLGVTDIICGTAATLLAAISSYYLRKVRIFSLPILAPLPPVIFNSIIVGAELSLITTPDSPQVAFISSALSVGIGEIVVCYGLGLPLYALIKKTKLFKDIM